MGYALCSLGVLVLWVLLTVYRKARLQMLDSVCRATPHLYMKLNPPEQFFCYLEPFDQRDPFLRT